MLVLILIGLLSIFSATYIPEEGLSIFFKKQCIGVIIGFACYFFFAFFPMNRLMCWGAYLYIIVLFFLGYTILAGWIGMGAKRWVNLYFFRAQPSEAAKMFCPIFLGYYFDEVRRYSYHVFTPQRFIFFVPPLCIIAVSALLIMKQPDLGTSLLVLIGSLICLWCAGLSRSFFITVATISLIASPVLWQQLKPYQKTRILVLLGYGDIKKERYQVEQSMIAIGSGGLYGKGLLNGTQNRFDFLPEDHTDFIFSIICEEWGFLGALVVLLLFGVLITRILFRVMLIQSFSEQIAAVGLMAHIFLSVCINIGMVNGILPVVGIPLPLLSYGLSNLLITMSTLGWLNNTRTIQGYSK